jgi:5-methylcytosine-specific restriction endonuclease McrBC regulatory subunit McrC
MTALVEYKPRSVEIIPGDLSHILELNRAADDEARILRSVTPTGKPNTYQIEAGPYVGRLGLPSGAWIDFQSRFNFHDVIELIRASTRPALRVDALRVPGQPNPFLIDAIAIAFIREVGSLAAGGLAKSYRSIRRLSPPYPGRIEVAYHISRFAGRADKLVTIARKLTTNIPENQALASALTALSRVPLRADTADRLAALGPVFARVDQQPMRGEDVRKITLTNLTRRYGHALALAEVILSARQLAPRGAELEGASIVFWMPKIWESYVASWIRGQWPDHVVEAPYRFVLTNTGETAEADAVVLDGKDVVALYDAKYKWPTSAPVRNDLYQMVTYCDRLGLNDATLVYPATSVPRTVSVRNKHVHVHGINPETIGALSHAV